MGATEMLVNTSTWKEDPHKMFTPKGLIREGKHFKGFKTCLSWFDDPIEIIILLSVVAERLRASNSNPGVSFQQSVGTNPQP